MIKGLVVLSCLLGMNSVQQSDSLKTVQQGSDRNMMLNAESATVPREINIGLPDTGNGAAVYLDGSKHSFGIPEGYQHWAGACHSHWLYHVLCIGICRHRVRVPQRI